MDTLLLGGVLTLYTLLNTVIPLSGSVTATPLLALLTDPHTALGLAGFYFFLYSVVRLYFFREFIVWKEVKNIILISAISALIGSLSLVAVPPQLLYGVVFLSALYFLFKKIGIIKKGAERKHAATFVGIASGFLQGTGLAGSDLRNSYLYSKGLNMSQVHGTTTIIAIVNFSIATAIRLFTNQVTATDLRPVVYVLPFVILGVWGGKFLLNKIDKKQADYLVSFIMAGIVISLAFKLFV